MKLVLVLLLSVRLRMRLGLSRKLVLALLSLILTMLVILMLCIRACVVVNHCDPTRSTNDDYSLARSKVTATLDKFLTALLFHGRD